MTRAAAFALCVAALFVCTEAGEFEDLGKGCCSDWEAEATLLFSDSHGSPKDCKAKCLEFPNCGFAISGWADGDWCTVLSDKAACPSINAGSTDCLTGGNTGVRTYKFVPPATAKEGERCNPGAHLLCQEGLECSAPPAKDGHPQLGASSVCVAKTEAAEKALKATDEEAAEEKPADKAAAEQEAKRQADEIVFQHRRQQQHQRQQASWQRAMEERAQRWKTQQQQQEQEQLQRQQEEEAQEEEGTGYARLVADGRVQAAAAMTNPFAIAAAAAALGLAALGVVATRGSRALPAQPDAAFSLMQRGPDRDCEE